jgi:hypothetical protein
MLQEQLLGALSGAYDDVLPVGAIERYLAGLGFAVESPRLDLWDGQRGRGSRSSPSRLHRLR